MTDPELQRAIAAMTPERRREVEQIGTDIAQRVDDLFRSFENNPQELRRLLDTPKEWLQKVGVSASLSTEDEEAVRAAFGASESTPCWLCLAKVLAIVLGIVAAVVVITVVLAPTVAAAIVASFAAWAIFDSLVIDIVGVIATGVPAIACPLLGDC